MGKLKRGGYIFMSWIGDHSPKHVHIYNDKGFLLKWDLERSKPIEGKASKKLIRMIQALVEEGKL